MKGKGEMNTPTSGKGKESMETRGGGRRSRESREKRVRSLCSLAGVEATRELVESLAPLDVPGVVAVLRQLALGRSLSAPRSAHAGSVRLAEGRHSGRGEAKRWAERLLG